MLFGGLHVPSPFTPPPPLPTPCVTFVFLSLLRFTAILTLSSCSIAIFAVVLIPCHISAYLSFVLCCCCCAFCLSVCMLLWLSGSLGLWSYTAASRLCPGHFTTLAAFDSCFWIMIPIPGFCFCFLFSGPLFRWAMGSVSNSAQGFALDLLALPLLKKTVYVRLSATLLPNRCLVCLCCNRVTSFRFCVPFLLKSRSKIGAIEKSLWRLNAYRLFSICFRLDNAQIND